MKMKRHLKGPVRVFLGAIGLLLIQRSNYYFGIGRDITLSDGAIALNRFTEWAPLDVWAWAYFVVGAAAFVAALLPGNPGVTLGKVSFISAVLLSGLYTCGFLTAYLDGHSSLAWYAFMQSVLIIVAISCIMWTPISELEDPRPLPTIEY